MRNRLVLLLLLVSAWLPMRAADFDDLLPRPASVTGRSGELLLKKGFKVSVAKDVPQDMADEAAKFVGAVNSTTGLEARITDKAGLVCLDHDASVSAEGYRLDIGKKMVKISASTPAGAFYAFQTLKQLLPAHVSAGTRAESGVYALPLGEIVDEPRYEYRGFMLDVSRHFFTVAEIKKMLDLMAVYKLNRFHWHLTDDQGWRLPVAKYPALTEKGATNRNILLSDFTAQKQWRAGEDVVYGPFAYTADDIREIVQYAGARHIDVIPEVDMPGHMVAAIHAYPELSTDPRSEKTSLHEDFSHEIWNKGGVSRDVLDVSNPKVMQFAKDVVDALADLFPCEYIHIGGDECPTLAWEHSDSCKAMMERLGMKDARALQSWFTKEIADYARERHGRKVMGWNELVSEGNVDMDMIRAIDPVIFCWIGGEKESEEAGLKFVYTPFNGGYYINRSYKGFDTIGAMKDGALRTTIEVLPPDYGNCIGVQGTFWTEQVDRAEDMEYLALPRLLGIAEQGWSHDREKDYADFLRRVNRATDYLRLAGFNYGAHQLGEPE